jgi:hypothetical protein
MNPISATKTYDFGVNGFFLTRSVCSRCCFPLNLPGRMDLNPERILISG